MPVLHTLYWFPIGVGRGGYSPLKRRGNASTIFYPKFAWNWRKLNYPKRSRAIIPLNPPPMTHFWSSHAGTDTTFLFLFFLKSGHHRTIEAAADNLIHCYGLHDRGTLGTRKLNRALSTRILNRTPQTGKLNRTSRPRQIK